MNLYKKLGSGKRYFDPSKANENPPESCGYSLRFFQLVGNCIEVRINKKVEMKININDLNQILIPPQTRKFIAKYKRDVTTKPNSGNLISTVKSNEINEYVNFQLVLEKTSIDLIAHNYMAYISFADGIEAFLRYKKNKTVNEFLFHCYNN